MSARGGLAQNAAGHAAEGDERAGLHRLQEADFGLAERLAGRFEVVHLAARHAGNAARPRQRQAEIGAHGRVRMRIGRGEDLEGERQQAVAGQDRGRLVKRLVRRGPPAPQVVIVHGGQIVVNQRIAVHAFKRRRRVQRPLDGHAEQRRALDHKERPHPLAAAQRAIAHRFEQARGGRPDAGGR